MLSLNRTTSFSGNCLINLCAAGLCLLLATSCSKEYADTGIGVLPEDQLIYAALIDSMEVTLETRKKDYVRTDNRSYQLLGGVLDPEFGRISASIYTEVLPATANLDLGDTSKLRLDSAVLKVRLAGYYGRGEDPVRVHVHELSQAIPDTVIFSNQTLSYAAENEVATPVTIDLVSGTATQNVSFRLTPEFGNKLLKADKADLADDESFRAFMKGLVFTAEKPALLSREPGAMLVVQNAYTAILLYFSVKNDSTGLYEEGAASPQGFVASGGANCFHTFTREDYEWRTFGAGLNENQYEFLQAGTLVSLFCKVPGLSTLSRKTIHKAELFLQVDTTLFGSQQTSGNRYNPPSSVAVFSADSMGNMRYDSLGRAELLISSVSYDNTRKGYPIGITSLVQAIVNGQETNDGFILVPKDSSTSIFRAAIFGSATPNPDKKPKISIYYSTIP